MFFFKKTNAAKYPKCDLWILFSTIEKIKEMHYEPILIGKARHGKGFDISNNPKHSGLASMKGRADSINALLSVKSVL